MNAPHAIKLHCAACGESCEASALYDAPDDSGLVCGACLDAALSESEERAPFDDEHGYTRWSTP